MKINSDSIPIELKALSLWVNWRSELIDDKRKKPPYSPRSEQKINVNDESNLADFATVLRAYQTGKFDGIGIVHPGIDVDHCYNAKTRELEPWADEIVNMFNSYTEVSPSGDGLHIFAAGSVPTKIVKGLSSPDGKSRGKIEVLARNHYLTVTGHRLRGTPDKVRRRQKTYRALIARLSDKPKTLGDWRYRAQLGLARKIPKECHHRKRFVRLWNGDFDGFPSQSEADFHFIGMLSTLCDDPEWIKLIFQRSGLYRTTKAKDYVDRTIRKAIPEYARITGKSRKQPAETKRASSRETALDLYGKNFPAVRWAIQKLIHRGATILAGKPKVGKSWIVLQLAIAVACGGTALDHFAVPKKGKVLLLALEDNPGRINRRLHKLVTSAKGLENLEVVNDGRDLLANNGKKLRRLLEQENYALVIIDTLTSVLDSKAKGTYRSEYNEIRLIQDLAHRYRTAIVGVYHTRKRQADYVLDLVSGTTGITGGVDSVIVMQGQDGRATLHVVSREAESENYSIALSFPTGWRVVEKAAAISDERRAILQLLEKERRLRPKDIAKALNANPSTTRVHLRNMALDRQVEKVGDQYRLPKPPSANSARRTSPPAQGKHRGGKQHKHPKRKQSS